jgi:hypothetical protein
MLAARAQLTANSAGMRAVVLRIDNGPRLGALRRHSRHLSMLLKAPL